MALTFAPMSAIYLSGGVTAALLQECVDAAMLENASPEYAMNR